MLDLLARRLWKLPLNLLGVSVVVFVLVYNLPGDPTSLLLNPAAPLQQRQALQQQLGLDLPLWQRYGHWLSQLVRGNWGYSISYQQQVVPLLGQKLAITLLLSLPAVFLSGGIALLVGLGAALNKDRFFDHLTSLVATLGVSLPAFFFGLLLLRLFAFEWGWFPLVGMVPGEKLSSAELLSRLTLPLLSLTLLRSCRYLPYVRNAVVEILGLNFLRYARARGFRRRRIVFCHLLPNSLTPLVTLLCLSLGNIFSGAILTETVFSWPGMGSLVYQAVTSRDYPLLIGATMLFALLTCLANLLADLVQLGLNSEIARE